jgi:hypothetical protein
MQRNWKPPSQQPKGTRVVKVCLQDQLGSVRRVSDRLRVCGWLHLRDGFDAQQCKGARDRRTRQPCEL